MKRFVGILLTLFSVFVCEAGEVGGVASPDGRNVVVLQLDDAGSPTYTLSRDGSELIAPSMLGMETSRGNFFTGLTLVRSVTLETNETYTLPVGKTSTYVNHYKELRAQFIKDDYTMTVQMRVYDDGLAFRYQFAGRLSLQAKADSSQVCIPKCSKIWALPYVNHYEGHYTGRTWAGTVSAAERACAPVLVKTSLGNDSWCLITDAAVDARFCTSSITFGTAAEKGKLKYFLEGTPNNRLPYETPWRVVFIGSLTDMVESTLCENLNPPTAYDDTSWIRPGLSSWDWGGLDGRQTKDLEVIKEFIDMAAKMGWPYFTLDDGWDGAPYDLTAVTSYAEERGVKCFIWSHQNRFQNSETQIRSILQDWKSKGFVGAKIDFFEDDSQSMMSKYDKLLRVAGELQFMLNFHGCTKPSGLRRTYPHFLSCEAVYGNEQYYYNSTATPATHNISLAFTRNVVGPMEYTPVEFARRDGVIRHTTTWSHQVALAIIFESAIQTIADSGDNIIYNTAAPLLSTLPAAWDETRCLEANADNFVTVARRQGDDWYVGSVSSRLRTLSLPLDFLGSGTYTAQIYKDGTCPSDIQYEEKSVTRASTLSLLVKVSGGVSIRLSKQPVRQPAPFVLEAEKATFKGGITTETDGDGNCSGGKYVGWVGSGNTVTFKFDAPAEGVYDLTLFFITMEDRDCYIQVNNGEKTYYSLKSNGFSWNSDGLACHTVQVTLPQGASTIAIGNDNGYAPNFDRIQLARSRYENPATGIMAPLQLRPRPASPGGGEGKSAAYDLQGRKIAGNPSSFISHPSSQKDIFIVGGKKIVVR